MLREKAKISGLGQPKQDIQPPTNIIYRDPYNMLYVTGYNDARMASFDSGNAEISRALSTMFSNQLRDLQICCLKFQGIQGGPEVRRVPFYFGIW
jgi:hypothetical protein